NRPCSVGLGFERRAQRELHVGGCQRQAAAFGVEEDPAEDLHGRARRDGAGNDAELLSELFARTGDLHRPGANHGFCIKHLDKSSRRSHRECGCRGRRCQAAQLRGFVGGRSLGRTRTLRQAWEARSAHSTLHRTCLIRAVNSCTRLYTERSSRIMRAIFEVAWMTVVWSRPPNCLPILGSEESVSSRERYIATWRG